MHGSIDQLREPKVAAWLCCFAARNSEIKACSCFIAMWLALTEKQRLNEWTQDLKWVVIAESGRRYVRKKQNISRTSSFLIGK